MTCYVNCREVKGYWPFEVEEVYFQGIVCFYDVLCKLADGVRVEYSSVYIYTGATSSVCGQ